MQFVVKFCTVEYCMHFVHFSIATCHISAMGYLRRSMEQNGTATVERSRFCLDRYLNVRGNNLKWMLQFKVDKGLEKRKFV